MVTFNQDAARERLRTVMMQGRQSALTLAENLARIPVLDDIAMTATESPILFGGGKLFMELPGRETRAMHPNALRQLAERLSVAPGWSQEWLSEPEEWKHEAIADLFATAWKNEKRQRLLIRGGERDVKAALSDKYRRLDTPTIVREFLNGTERAGLAPSVVKLGDLSWSITVAPQEPMALSLPGGRTDWIAPSFVLSSSDYGLRALELRLNVMRLICMNGAIGTALQRQVHLGRSIPDGVRLMEDTMKADTKASTLLLRDVLSSTATPERLQQLMAPVHEAIGEVIPDVKATTKGMVKARRISQEQAARIEELVMQRDGTLVPEGPVTRWSLAQALSATVSEATDHEKAIEIERTAYRIIANDWKEES